MFPTFALITGTNAHFVYRHSIFNCKHNKKKKFLSLFKNI